MICIKYLFLATIKQFEVFSHARVKVSEREKQQIKYIYIYYFNQFFHVKTNNNMYGIERISLI